MEKISALCVTRGNAKLLTRAIQCFNVQTHPNRELVIVHEGLVDHPELKELHERRGPNEQWVYNPPGLTLGERRNIALESATGAYVMTWDDDDWYDPKRMEIQLTFLEMDKVDGLMLQNLILWDAEKGDFYLSFDRPRGWEQTILMKRDAALKIRYPHSDKGEDSQFVARFNTQFKLKTRGGFNWLYVYTYHGGNTWDRKHFEGLYKKSKKLPVTSEFMTLTDHGVRFKGSKDAEDR